MADWVLAVERAYVAAATGDPIRARAAAGAVASRYLAVGTPRTLATIIATASPADAALAAASIEAHATWFSPRALRGATLDGTPSPVGTPCSVAEALASDIVCVHAPLALRATELRRGTHVNALAPVTLDDDLRRIAVIIDELPGLAQLAAGLIDGRQLDELTIFIAGDTAIALAATATTPSASSG